MHHAQPARGHRRLIRDSRLQARDVLVRSQERDPTFDANGFVSTVATEGPSGAAAALTSLAGLPESFAGGVENVTKAYTNIQAAGGASLEAENARLKADIERRHQQLTAAGLDATGADAAELQRLNQLQAILASQTAITGTDPSLVAALAHRASGDLDWSHPPAPADAPEPQGIRVVLAGGPEGPTEPGKPVTPPVLLGVSHLRFTPDADVYGHAELRMLAVGAAENARSPCIPTEPVAKWGLWRQPVTS